MKVESEVERLDQLKASKMKELFLRKQIELEEVCKKSHMEIPSQSEIDKILNLIMSGKSGGQLSTASNKFLMVVSQIKCLH